MNLVEIVNKGTSLKASDVHLTVTLPPIFRIHGELVKSDFPVLTPDDTKVLIRECLTSKQLAELEETGQIDTSFSSPGVGRYRVNAYRQRGSYAIALRTIPFNIPTIDEMKLPEVFKEISMLPRGLILVTGPTGSGKSTTLASMINHININEKAHILTLEDPIEFLHKNKESMVNQREIGLDSDSFSSGLRAALRQDPDVILVGEMRDLETISIAISAAETGHLVMSTLHTLGAAKTVDRIIDVFPPHQQSQVRVQFASVVQAIISQQLLPRADGSGRVGAYEIMIATPAIRNQIREDKVYQIDTAIQTGGKLKMQTMDTSLLNLCRSGVITPKDCISQAVNAEQMKTQLMGV